MRRAIIWDINKALAHRISTKYAYKNGGKTHQRYPRQNQNYVIQLKYSLLISVETLYHIDAPQLKSHTALPVRRRTTPVFIINLSVFKQYASPLEIEKFLKLLSETKVEFALTSSNSDHESPLLAPTALHPSAFHPKKKHLILSNALVNVYQQSAKLVPLYWIVQPTTTTKLEPALFIQSTHQIVLFLKTQGYPHCTVYFCPDANKMVYIPAPSNGRALDINRKIINSLFLYFQKSALAEFKLKVLPKLEDKRFLNLQFPKKSSWEEVDTLTQSTQATLFSCLKTTGILTPVPSIKTNTPTKTPDTKLSFPKSVPRAEQTCPFCKENVIRNQLVVNFEKFLLLINYKPFPGTKVHFLILPTRHLEDWSFLDTEERNQLAKIITHLLKSIQVNCETTSNEIIAHLQNGLQAGQTFSHTHLHLMTRPKLIPYLMQIYSQSLGRDTAILSAAEMHKMGNTFKPLLFQGLLSQSSPRRHLISSHHKKEKEVIRSKQIVKA